MKLYTFTTVLGLIFLTSCNTTEKNMTSNMMKTEEAHMQNKLTLDIYKGETAHVNTYLFSNGKSLAVLDVQRSSAEAEKLVKLIKSKKLPLTHIFISHGHPDHYTGMDVLKKEFPNVKIVVATDDIKQDISGFSTWMESVGWLDAEPNLKPKTGKNPNGFDYDGQIHALNTSTFTLDGGGTLDLNTDFLPAEAHHLTTLYSKDLNGLFTADWCYNGVHLWFGQGVSKEHIANWRKQLVKFKEQYGNSDIKIYPGHGDETDAKIFDTLITYIDNFTRIIKESTTEEEAMNKMKALYPTYKEADFLLLNSVNYHMSLKNK